MGIADQRKISLWMQTAMAVAVSKSPVTSSKQLNLSITTVYRHLNALEQALQFKIFNRGRSGWVLRADADILLTNARKIEMLLTQTESEIRHAAGKEAGTLRIAVSDDFAAYYVTPLLGSFCQRYAEIKPELIISSDFADLPGNQADVAIRPDMDPGDSLVGHRVGRMTHAFYASPEYISSTHHPFITSDLSKHKICGYGLKLKEYTAARWLDKNVCANAIVARFDNTATIAQAVAQGLGIGLLPCFVGDSLPELSPVLNLNDKLPIDIWLVTAAANRKQPKVRAFFEFFAAKVRTDKSVFIGKPYCKSKN